MTDARFHRHPLLNSLARSGAALLLGLLVSTATWADSPVTVAYEHPEKFTDADDRGPTGRGASKSVMADLEAYLQKIGERSLPEGEALEITFTNIDLAGRFEPTRGAGVSDLRILRDITWPQLDFRYSLKRNGVEVAAGSETLRDMDYLRSSVGAPSGESLRYEKRMLDTWLRKLPTAAPSSSNN